MLFLSIDFETYWDTEYTLKKLNTSDYVMDPRFEVIGVSVICNGKRYWMEEAQFRAFAQSVDWSQVGILCHHTHFDGLIMSHHYGIKPFYWFDTLSMGRALHGAHKSNDLDSLGNEYGVGGKIKGVLETTLGKHRGDFTPEEWKTYGDYSVNDAIKTVAIFQKMLPVFPPQELDVIDITVRMYTEPSFVLDQIKMAEYLKYETERKAALLLQCSADKKVLGSNEKLADLFRQFEIEPPMKDSPKAKNPDGSPKRIYAFAKTDAGMQELLEHEVEEVRWLAEARVAIKSVGNESRTLRMLKLGAGGRPMPVYVGYAKASTTLRWGGADGRNWQNFEKPNKKDPKKGIIRKSICAPKGYKVVVADASQVEARFNGWHARQDDLIEQFANGEDVYSIFASDAYGRHVDRKKNPDDERPGQVGKICVLGLGYNMGWYKLALELLMGRGGAPKVQFTRDELFKLNIDPGQFLSNPRNVEQIKQMPSRLNEAERMIHCAVTNHFVEVYRRKNNMIAADWKYWNGVIRMLYEGTHVGAKVGQRGILEIVPDGLKAPGGQIIRYPHIRYENKQFSYLGGKGQMKKLHGGVVVENITQFLCRCLIADAMRDLYWGRIRRGQHPYQVAMTEHDAIACVVEEDRAQECLDDLILAISHRPDWAPDLPLAAEGGIGDNIGSAK